MNMQRIFRKRTHVVQCEVIAERFHLITLESPEFCNADWVPGQKVQLGIGTGFASRTYTPMDWDTGTGRTYLLDIERSLFDAEHAGATIVLPGKAPSVKRLRRTQGESGVSATRLMCRAAHSNGPQAHAVLMQNLRLAPGRKRPKQTVGAHVVL